jgi:hypothetical protein
MLLSPKDVELFFKLHRSLMFFVDQKLHMLPDRPADPDEYSSLAPPERFEVHDALLKNMGLIQSFVDENPARLSREDLGIVLSWRRLVHGKFFIFRELAKYTVFLSAEKSIIAYGVTALTQPFEELIGPHLPVLVQTTLLPFKDRIVYDGLMSISNISFGAGIRRHLNEDFKAAKTRHGIITSLPISDAPMPASRPKAGPIPKAPSRQDAAEIAQVIVGMIDPFCREHLNEEYARLCRELTEKLARKRPSPLLTSSANAWASGIVRTVGWVNFLQDRSQTPYMRLGDIDAHFGVSQSSGAAKVAAIRKMLRIHQLDPNWTLPSRMDDNPLVWMIQVDGFMMDVRDAPREVQEIAFKKGLIPYILEARQCETALGEIETSDDDSGI